MIAVAWIAFWILLGLSIVSAPLAYGFGRILRAGLVAAAAITTLTLAFVCQSSSNTERRRAE